jgi:two-component system nitrate/nitrite response regulator NarL
LPARRICLAPFYCYSERVPPLPAATPIRIAVVAEDPLARAGLVALVTAHSELTLVAQGSPAEASTLATRADVLLWDVGTDAADTAFVDAASVVALVPDERQASASLAAGALAVLSRDVPASRLVAAMAAVNVGLLVIDESFADLLGRRDSTLAPPVEPLTPRELEVLTLLGEGLSNKAIAARLGISESTAKFHVNSILAKLGVANRSEAIVHASRLGLVVL